MDFITEPIINIYPDPHDPPLQYIMYTAYIMYMNILHCPKLTIYGLRATNFCEPEHKFMNPNKILTISV